MTSIYFILSIEARLVTHFSGYATITRHEKAMLYVLNHDFRLKPTLLLTYSRVATGYLKYLKYSNILEINFDT